MTSKKYLSLDKLESGMIIADNVYDTSSHLIVPAGSEITDTLIMRLNFYAIRHVLVIVDSTVSVKDRFVSDNYSERIRASFSYQKFRSTFTTTVSALENTVNQILEHSLPQQSVTMLIDSTSKLLHLSENNLYIFDILHSMHELDNSTFSHSVNVALIASVLGKWCGYDEHGIEILILCGLFHDVGKLLIPSEILQKPSKLTDEEFDIIRTHPIAAYELLKTLDLDKRVLQTALSHHERCDGSGYPLKLRGEDIPDFVKIISIADVYDAITAARVYKNAVCPFQVIAIFEEEGFELYDPKFLLPFIKNVVYSYIHDYVALSNGEVGEVVMINPRFLSRPVIKTADSFIDLSKRRDIQIEAIL